jgi:hypothetical protein
MAGLMKIRIGIIIFIRRRRIRKSRDSHILRDLRCSIGTTMGILRNHTANNATSTWVLESTLGHRAFRKTMLTLLAPEAA